MSETEIIAQAYIDGLIDSLNKGHKAILIPSILQALREIQDIAKQKGGECLSTAYLGIEIPHFCKCKNPETDKYDEDKVMLGFGSKEEAEKVFCQHYDDPEKFHLDTTTMTLDDFKKKILSDFDKGKQTKLLKAAAMRYYGIAVFTSALSGINRQ